MFSKDIGIDLGTANVLIYIKGQGIVLNEPSVVAIDEETKRPVAVGTAAKEMLGRTPGQVKAIRPMKDGVIDDFEITEIMLNNFIRKVNGKSFFGRPRILICCPSNITQVEKNAIREAAEKTGARKVYLEEEPKVAAVGAGMEINKPSGNMVIDIGGGTTDVAVLSLGGIVTSSSIKIAGNVFDNDIIKYINENITDRLQISIIAAHFYLSDAYVCRAFKAQTGTTINKYITARRITIAKQYLAKGSTVLNACEKSGFRDYTNFVKAFTKLVGISPKKYEKLHAQERAPKKRA